MLARASTIYRDIPSVLHESLRLILLCREFLRDEKTPDRFIRVQILTGLTNGFFDFILLAAGPRIPSAFYAVERDTSILLTAGVRLNFGFHATLFLGGDFVLLWLFRAAIDLRPCLCTILGGNYRQTQVVFGPTVIRHNGIGSAIQNQSGNRPRRQTDHRLGH